MRTPSSRSLLSQPRWSSHQWLVLAAFLSSSKEFLMFRNFSYLRTRLLLEQQDQLRQLEDSLLIADLEDSRGNEEAKLRLRNRAEDISRETPENRRRSKIFEEAYKKFRQYDCGDIAILDLLRTDKTLTALRNLRAYQQPSRRAYEGVRRWFAACKPLTLEEYEYIKWREELVSLRTGESETFQGRVEAILIKFDCRLIRYLFTLPGQRAKTTNDKVVYYASSRLWILVNVIIVFVLSTLLILPVVILYRITETSAGMMKRICTHIEEPEATLHLDLHGRQNGLGTGSLVAWGSVALCASESKQMASENSAMAEDTPSPAIPQPSKLGSDNGLSRVARLRAQMERTTSESIREEGRELQQAVEQSKNVILDLTLDGHVRWVSPTWTDVVGTEAEDVHGKPIADLLVENKGVFTDALEALRHNDANSKVIRFSVGKGPKSKLRQNDDEEDFNSRTDHRGEAETAASTEHESETVDLEAQGILIYNRSTGEESHTMWMIRPAVQREVTIDLPEILLESLGVGAEMLARHLTIMADTGTGDPDSHPTPTPVLCRICERYITPWWFPKHTELCLQEHRAEAELELAHENLAEQRNQIVKVLDALEERIKHQRSPNLDPSTPIPPPAEYKSMEIGISSSHSASSSSTVSRSSSHHSHPGSRERSGTVRHHARARSFTVRRPVSRIAELVLDLCDTAMEISTPALKDTRGGHTGEIRSQSPQSEARISQVTNWSSPSAGALENEPGLALLCDDTGNLAKSKVDANAHFRQILEYSERIRNECTLLVDECMHEALEKARRIAAGESTGESSDDDSTSRGQPSEDGHESDEDRLEPEKSTLSSSVPESGEAQSAMANALRSAISSRSGSSSPSKRVSGSFSQRSSSPKECPTPRSRAAGSMTSYDKRSSMHTDTDPGAESDSSMISSAQSHHPRTESPASDVALSRKPSSRDRKRTSLVLPRAMSQSRGHSPGRPSLGQPLSPLHVLKPRVTSGSQDTAVKSPLASPTLSSSEFCSPILTAQQSMHQPQPQSQPPSQPPQHHHHHHHHHRRQSSAASSEISRPGVSPHLSMTSGPPQRAAPPSIKDFEIIKPISKGAFGSVYLAKKKSTGDYYAIKALKKADMVSKNQVANVKAERAIMMWQGESDFVAKLYWTFPSKDYIFLVMEYLNGGDCASLLRALGSLPEEWAKRYLAEVVLGVEHLHSREIVHRDLKPDNLLIDQKGHLKLTDFGLSRMGLIGRQKRALNAKHDQLHQDPLKQGPFARATSMTSSRSASFDINAAPSPSNTPTLTPVTGDASVPSYFTLSREPSISSREPTRSNSAHHSESTDSDYLHTALRRMSIFDELAKNSPLSEEGSRDEREPGESHHLHKSDSNAASHRFSNPPASGAMLPPPMALFDPDDSNRRFVGTPDYLAPETINGLGQDEMSDWWSIGCILFEFVFGYPPFHGSSPDQVFENILARRIDWPPEDVGVSAEVKDLMERLMTLDPSQRLGANIGDKFSNGGEEIRSHSWFSDVDWSTVNEAEASFVPNPQHVEDTEYFDPRGASNETFATEFEDQSSSPLPTPGEDYPDRPHDALSRVRNHTGANKRGLMPLHIPKHVREGRSRRLSEPGNSDDFGQFAYKNLPVLEKANKDVIQKLRAEAMQAQSRAPQHMPKSAPNQNSSPPLTETNSPLTMPLGRTLSQSSRPKSPSALHSLATSSPGRGSQPTSPLVQFSAGPHHERRKTSGASTQSSSSLQAQGFFDVPRMPASSYTQSSTGSPVRSAKSPGVLDTDAPTSAQLSVSTTSPRTRSRTVGARETEVLRDTASRHSKRKSQIMDVSPSSSDNDDSRQQALLRVQRRRQSSRRMSQINFADGPFFRPLDILVCEDHPVSRIIMSKLLETLRCRAIIVTDGGEATRYAMGSVKFDIIMMEFKLPQINGFDVARMLRETKNANRDTPIVAVTGYLKELQAPHHFNALIEKPPTQPKITEVLTKLCHWKPAQPGWQPQSYSFTSAGVPPSSLRNESLHSEESPTSTASSLQTMPSSWRSSSRDDSLSSGSVLTEPEPKLSEGSITLMRPAEDEVKRMPQGGLGISGGLLTDMRKGQMHPVAALKHEDSAPPVLAQGKPIRKQPSAEAVDAKRKALSKSSTGGGGDLGDDEDEELGKRARSRSPRGKTKPIDAPRPVAEMLRADSQGDVSPAVQDLDVNFANLAVSPPREDSLSVSIEETPRQHSSLTPPAFFSPRPGHETTTFDMDATPTPQGQGYFDPEGPTPKAE
ncbi:MAG: hypothetical protein Q9159_002443 [Coniocarpon cinnabarinum]